MILESKKNTQSFRICSRRSLESSKGSVREDGYHKYFLVIYLIIRIQKQYVSFSFN